MNKIIKWMETHFIPVAAKIGNQRHLVAIRDSFIAIMPITMVGSVAVLLNVFFRDLPTAAKWTGFVENMQWLININGIVWWASFAIISLAFIVSFGYHLAKDYDVNPIAGALVALSSYIVFIPQTASFEAEINGVKDLVSNWGLINVDYTGSAALFTALIVGFISTMIYIKLMQANVTIKLPDSVPPAVSKAFAAIIPSVVAIYASSVVAYLLDTYAQMPLNDIIAKYIQVPLMGLSQGVFSVILLSFLVQLFWFFGIHGHNVLAPIMDGIYLPATTANAEHYLKYGAEGFKDLPYIWTRGSFDAFGQMGGSGITIGLIIAIFIFSKREDSKAVAKLAAPMGMFNINEPITFGLPIVLNPVYAIPWLIVPPISVAIAYVLTTLGVIRPVIAAVPWVLPPGLYALLATGGDWIALVVSLALVALSVVIYTPFVILANNIEDKEI